MAGLNGRLGRWSALLSNWTLEIGRCVQGEDEILGIFGVSITLREEIVEMYIAIATKKQPRQTIYATRKMKTLVVSFDGSA